MTDVYDYLKDFKRTMLNPVILEQSKEETDYSEGCLSIPGIYCEVSRPKSMTVEYYNENGEKVTEKFDKFACRMVQREMSSLGGGMNFYGQLPVSYNITVNAENPLIEKILEAEKAQVKPLEVVADADPEIVKAGEAKDATDEQKKAAEDAKNAAREAKDAAYSVHKADIEAFASQNEVLQQIADLALLANGLLKGKALSEFIARSQKVVSDAYLK